MIDVSQLDPDFDTTLRSYQIKYKKQIYRLWEEHRSVMLQMPTGTGKTRVFTSIIKDIHNLSIDQKKAIKVLVLVHRQELVEQASETLGFRYNIAHGVILSKYWQQKKLPIQIASVQTLVRRLPKWVKKNFDFIIIDEAHHALAKSYKQICSAFPSAKILGVTATPYRMNGASFRSLFDVIVISEPIEYFIKQKYLADYEYYSIAPTSRTQILIDSIKEFDVDGDYSAGAMMKVVNTQRVRADILKSYNAYARGKKGIVYTINRKHNEHVCKLYLDAGISAAHIDSRTKKEERKLLIEKFRAGKIQVLCNVNIFSEGFDCPDIEFIQLARPTASLSLFLQQVGRGLRIHPDVEKVIFLDNVGVYNKFGLPSEYRDWQSYFDGNYQPADQNTNLQVANLSSSVIFIEHIEDGDEDMFLQYSSKDQKETAYDEIVDYPIVMQREDAFSFQLRWIPSFYYSEVMDYIDPYDEDGQWQILENVNKVRNGSFWGLYDSDLKKEITPVCFDDIGESNFYGLAICKKNGKYGMINSLSGKEIVKFDFDEIHSLYYAGHMHLYAGRTKTQWGVLDDDNNLVTDFIYDEVSAEKEIINLRTGKSWVVFDLKTFEVINRFREGVRLGSYRKVSYEGLYGLSDLETDVVMEPFTNIDIEFQHGLFLLKRKPYRGFGDIYFVLNEKLENIFNAVFGRVEIASSDIILFNGIWQGEWRNGWGAANYEAEIIIEPQYEAIQVYEGQFLVRKDSQWHMINHSGELLFSNEKLKEVKNRCKQMQSNAKTKKQKAKTETENLQKPKRGKRPRIKIKGSKKIS